MGQELSTASPVREEEYVPPSCNAVPLRYNSKASEEICKSVLRSYVPTQNNDDLPKKPITKEITHILSGKFNTSDFTEWNVDSTSGLRELLIEDDCFGYVKDLKLSLFTSLERISIGDDCFCNTKGGTFELKECINVKSVTIGDNSFPSVRRVAFESDNIRK